MLFIAAPLFAAIVAGILFGAGLTVSGMSNPKKVLDFLDIAAIAKGGWDPTLLMINATFSKQFSAPNRSKLALATAHASGLAVIECP